jgi:hypothetical protein
LLLKNLVLDDGCNLTNAERPNDDKEIAQSQQERGHYGAIKSQKNEWPDQDRNDGHRQSLMASRFGRNSAQNAH